MTEERLLTVKTRISKKTLRYVLLLLLYFRPAVYVFGSSVYRVGTAGLTIELLYLVLVALLKHRNNRYQLSGVAGMLLMIFSWCLMGSTILNYFSGTEVSFSNAITFTVTAAGFILLADLGISDSPQIFLKSFVIVGSLACLINALTIFLYAGRGGMNQSAILSGGHQTYYFLAEDNATMYWSWPVIVVMWLYFFLFNNSKNMLAWNIVCTVTICAAYVFVRSLTAMLGTVALIFLVFHYRKASNKKKRGVHFKQGSPQFYFYWISSVVISYVVAVSQSWTKYAYLLELYFNKSATASGRTTIWKKSVYYIKQSWLIGYGQETVDYSVSKLRINHTHNFLLETFYRGGAIAAVMWVVLFVYISRKTQNVRNQIYSFLMLAVFLFLLMAVVDFAYYRYPYLILFILLGHTEVFKGEGRLTFYFDKRNRGNLQ